MSNIVKVFKLTLIICFVSIITPANSGGLDSLVKATKSLTEESADSKSNDLLTSLTKQLGVTESQAAGGTAALLAMASQNISSTDNSLLESIIPTGQPDSLTSQMLTQITDMDGVQKAFSALGLDASMVQQYAPILLQYVSENGGASLMDSLTKLWL